jgi:hypothetical protein
MSKRDKRPAPIVRKTNRGLSPVDAFFAEQIINDPLGTEYDLVKRTKRSNPQNSLYWVTLGHVVSATGKWPNAEKLHDALKRACGFVTVSYDMSGKEYITTDSTAFDAMTADEFREYFDQAMEKLADSLGFDPLAYLPRAA